MLEVFGMKVLILGVDGYLGWTLAQYLVVRGHEIWGCDNFNRRKWVSEVGSDSAVRIYSMSARLGVFEKVYNKPLNFLEGDVTDSFFVADMLTKSKCDVIVHLGEMPSAPYSMIDEAHCVETHINNLVGTLNILHSMKVLCPKAHLLKLGTMGEYGTPDCDIPEGIIPEKCLTDRPFFQHLECPMRGLSFPKSPGSFYHLTKVHDTNNIIFACKNWGLRSTDIMQGVVYGTKVDSLPDEEKGLLTRFDIDECFGTAINRFCAQAVISHPLTIYGSGLQKRGFLPLKDSMQCLTLAIENPPLQGEYRVFNQFEEVYKIADLAYKVKKVAALLGLHVDVGAVENPRVEQEHHYYNPDCSKLRKLGYVPTDDMDLELSNMLRDLIAHRSRITNLKSVLIPEIRWSGARRKSDYLSES